MTHPLPHPRNRPVRILFVFAWLAGGEEETLIRLLARTLDPARYRIDALPCLRLGGLSLPSHPGLVALGVDVDCTAYDLGFDETVNYLVRKMAGYEAVVSCQNVADIYPALEQMRHRPPLIEYGRQVAEALAGPKHFTTRYVGTDDTIRDAAAARMTGRSQDARTIAPIEDMHAPKRPVLVADNRVPHSASDHLFLDSVLLRRPGDAPTATPDVESRQWQALFDEVLTTTPAPPPNLFRSFVQGGFEASTHRLRSGRRIDVIAATGHDRHAESDYRQLARMGLRTVRDAARWHLIEQHPGQFDFSSFLPMARAAGQAGTQVIWDLLHYGWPDDIDIWSPAFVDRFAAFAHATGCLWREVTDEVPFWCPINEISFFAWAGGDAQYLNPFAAGRGFELKVQLARASIAAMHTLRAVDPRARFVHCEPLIAIQHDASLAHPHWQAEGWHQAQFQAFELLSGQMWPQIGGDASLLDIVGVNYYINNQWFHGGPSIDVDHPAYRPLSDLLFETYARYKRPIFVSETGVEDQRRAPWVKYVAAEVARARQRGVPVEGLCLYPVMNHPGWDDDRDCQNGVLTQHFEGRIRGTDAAMARAVAEVVASSPLPSSADPLAAYNPDPHSIAKVE